MNITKPMLAKRIKENTEEEHFKNPNEIAQLKFDGTGVWVSKETTIQIHTARNWKSEVAQNYPDVVAEIMSAKTKFKAHGEMTFINKLTGREEFLTILATPETRSKYHCILWLHDIIAYHTKDTCWIDVSKNGYLARWHLLKSLIPNNLEHIKIAPIAETETDKRKMWNDVINKRVPQSEGIMFKNINATYEFGTRSSNCLKLKTMYTTHMNTADCIIVGHTEGKGKFTGKTGALILAQVDGTDLKYAGKCSGMDDATRSQLSEMIDSSSNIMPFNKHPEGLTSKEIRCWCTPSIVVEISYHEHTKDGIFRFPEFQRLRTDKQPQDCLVSNDE